MTDKNLQNVRIISFGFKYGPAPEANLVEDVRWVPNPYWDLSLRELTGADPRVHEFILAQPDVAEFIDEMRTSLRRRLRGYRQSNYHDTLTIAFGCTGGKHRSRFFAFKCAEILADLLPEFNVVSNIVVEHRDCE